MLEHLILFALTLGTYAAPQNFAAKEIPAKGDNGQVGGIFGLAPGAKRPSQTAGISAMTPGKDTPKTTVMNDNSPGSGPYPAAYFSDNTLPNHTIYAPKSPPKDTKLPVVIWGNGGCGSSGTSFQNILREIASHGFVAIANGAATGGTLMAQTKMNLMTESLDWVMKGTANGKYGQIDSSKIAAAGQSCGGLEAYSATYHDDRVKTAMIMNSGVIDEEKKYLLGEFKVPIAYFIGGPKDIAYNMAEKDYQILPKGLPAVKANLDTGHGGTYRAINGGKFGKIAVAYLKWVLKDDQESKKLFLDENSPFVKDGWNISTKNWN